MNTNINVLYLLFLLNLIIIFYFMFYDQSLLLLYCLLLLITSNITNNMINVFFISITLFYFVLLLRFITKEEVNNYQYLIKQQIQYINEEGTNLNEYKNIDDKDYIFFSKTKDTFDIRSLLTKWNESFLYLD